MAMAVAQFRPPTLGAGRKTALGASRPTAPAFAHDPQTLLQRLRQSAVAATGAAILLMAGGPADAKSSLLDLPSCSKFTAAAAGIEFCDVRQGSGDSPQVGDQVIVDYTARVADTNKVYEGSRGFEFMLGEQEVVPGWELAVLGGDGVPPIKEGGVRTVRIPASLAYGGDGFSCLYGLSTSCRVPPGSSVVISFQYNGTAF